MLTVLVLWIVPMSVHALSGAYILDRGETVFGFPRHYTIKDDSETLVRLAIQYDLGYNEIVAANPDIDPWYPGKGTKVVLPTSWILPHGIPYSDKHYTLVINLAELRLYMVKREGERLRVFTFPVGIGSEGYDTPIGVFRIIEKIRRPTWFVPESIRKEDPELPPLVPPGPDNPLGEFALRLSNPSYLIHGTNKPLGVGRRISHGCIRMYPADIEKVFSRAEVGDPVYIVSQPVKLGKRNGKVYIEIEPGGGENLLQETLNVLRGAPLDTLTLYRFVKEAKGFPQHYPLLNLSSNTSLMRSRGGSTPVQRRNASAP